jgi:hypothetical protein
MTAEVWSVMDQDADSGVMTFAYDRTIPCKFVTRKLGSSLLADVGLDLFDQLRNVRDMNGVEVNPGGIYVIKQLLPVTNVFGFVEGMSYTVTSATTGTLI